MMKKRAERFSSCPQPCLSASSWYKEVTRKPPGQPSKNTWNLYQCGPSRLLRPASALLSPNVSSPFLFCVGCITRRRGPLTSQNSKQWLYKVTKRGPIGRGEGVQGQEGHEKVVRWSGRKWAPWGCLPLRLLPHSPGTHWIAGTICSSPFPRLCGSLSS